MIKKTNEQYITQIFETTNATKAEWFGYYNYDVISSDGEKMLCNRADFDGRAIIASDAIELGYYDIATGEWHHIDYTDSFNWQQGGMLQWLPGIGNENKVIYNFSDKKHFYSAIYDISTGEKRIINFPTYCVTPDGKYSISLNYERSYWCRAYHYQAVKNPVYDVQVAEDDGIFEVDLENNTVKRIVAIQDVINVDFDESFAASKHWLEHVMINPDGTKFAFLHRFSYGNGYRTRLFIANVDGEGLQIIKGWKNKEWSHFGWKDNREFCIYTVDNGEFAHKYTQSVMLENNSKKRTSPKIIVRNIVRSILPQFVKDKLIGRKKYYQHYVEENGEFVLRNKYDGKLFDIDGHPSFTKGGKYLITDSYPDSAGMQRLIIYNTENGKGFIVGRFKAPLSGNPASCDLHPKLSFGGKYIVVDTAYIGKHRMIVFNINWKAVKKALS